MAQRKDDIKHATAQAKLSEDEALRVGHVAGTPLEAGKIADSEPIDFFLGAQKIHKQRGHDFHHDRNPKGDQVQEKNEALRVGHVAGTPLEAGKIADSEPIDFFLGAQKIHKQRGHDFHHDRNPKVDQVQEKNEALRVGYVAGTSLEAGKIADSEPIDFFLGAQKIHKQRGHDFHHDRSPKGDQVQEKNARTNAFTDGSLGGNKS